MSMRGLTIGTVAKSAGVGVETIRFYERQGLLDQPQRPAGGFCHYPEDVVIRVRFIRRAKETAQTITEGLLRFLFLREYPLSTDSA